MKALYTIPVKITTDPHAAKEKQKLSRGEVEIRNWTKKERLVRSLKFGGACWGGAVVTFFIPGLHFLLVPAFLIVGPLAAFHFLNQERVIVGGKGLCPSCKAPLKIEGAGYKFPLSELCTQCQTDLKIFEN